jgi:hypothetical protein
MGVDSDSSTLAVILLNNQINEVVASPLAYPSVLVCGPKWGTLGRAQDRASAASRNDGLG